MKVVNKSRAPITLDVSENGDIIAQDIYGHPVPLRMSEALKARFAKRAHLPATDLQPGTIMTDGTVYAGTSPDRGRAFYAAAHDEPELLKWYEALDRAANKDAHGHRDWRVPTKDELNVLFNNRAVIGGFDGFDVGGSFPAGWYWSSSESATSHARFQRFSDGTQDYYFKIRGLSVRCVRG